MSAVCADSASDRRIGSAEASIWRLRPPTSVCRSTVTPVSLPPVMTAATRIVPYGVWIGSPVKVPCRTVRREAGGRVFAPPGPAAGAEVEPDPVPSSADFEAPAGCDLNDSRSARPTAVDTSETATLITTVSPFPPCSEVEGLDVDAAPWHPRAPELPGRGLDQPRRPAHVVVPPGRVGYEPEQRPGVERVAAPHRVPAHDRVEAESPVAGDGPQLRPDDQVLPPRRPVEQDLVRAGSRQCLVQRADRRDPHTAGDQQARTPTAGADRAATRRECPVRSLAPHPGTPAQPAEPPAAVSEVLDGDAHRAVGRRRREGVRVGLPPQPARQEPPPQELPRLGAEPVPPTGGQGGGGDAG